MTINDIIQIEKGLLQIQKDEKFKMDFNDILKVDKYIKKIGEITSLYFETLYEYSETINKIDKLTEYKQKLDGEEVDSEVETVINEIKNFINILSEKYKFESIS